MVRAMVVCGFVCCDLLLVTLHFFVAARGRRPYRQRFLRRRKTPQNATKRRKYRELAIILRGTKYLGGGEKPRPLLGGRGPPFGGGRGPPFPPENIFLVSSRPVTKPTYDEIQKKAKKNSVGCKHRHYSERPFFLFFAETVVCPFMARDHLGKLGWKNKF